MAALNYETRMAILSASRPVFITASAYMAQKLATLGAVAISATASSGKPWDNYEEISNTLVSHDVVFVGDAPDLLTVRPKSERRLEQVRTAEDVKNALNPDYRPATQEKKIKPQINEQIFRSIMHERGISFEWNEISGRLDFHFEQNNDWFTAQIEKEDAAHVLRDRLRQDYTGASLEWVGATILHMAHLNRYNPVLDLIQRTKWDGVDRLPQVYALLGLEDSDRLSRELLHLWFKQGIALLHNTPEKRISGEAVLVLYGKQGYGKTTFFAHMAIRPEWFRAGQSISSFDKDNARRCITTWISELGEIETTFKKADSEALKNFITQPFDEYRLPYGRMDEENPRHTLLAGTANSDDFLTDTTGNRRFWLVPLNRRIPREELEALDALQLWAQVYQEVKGCDLGACFRPDEWTRDALEERNSQHLTPLKGEIEVRDALEAIMSGNYEMREITLTAWKNMQPSLERVAARHLGRILQKLGFECTRTKTGRFYLLPVRKYQA